MNKISFFVRTAIFLIYMIKTQRTCPAKKAEQILCVFFVCRKRMFNKAIFLTLLYIYFTAKFKVQNILFL